MSGTLPRYVDQQRAIKMFADWTDRIAAGELPPVPPRPQGVERNVVISMWDWGKLSGHPHDEMRTDKRHPTVNANGKIYAADYNTDSSCGSIRSRTLSGAIDSNRSRQVSDADHLVKGHCRCHRRIGAKRWRWAMESMGHTTR